jgi:uncharacterized protein YjiS (DUF1127 family)
MTHKLVSDLRKFAAYRKTLRALREMPLDTQLDLALGPQDMRQIAHKAVYGD